MQRNRFSAAVVALCATAAFTIVTVPAPAKAYPHPCMQRALTKCQQYELGTPEFDACYYPAYDNCMASWETDPPPPPPPFDPWP